MNFNQNINKGGTMRKVFEKFLLGNMATPQNYAIYIGKSIFEEKKNFGSPATY